ncbi:hypothetical protein VM1G_04444 [Cytospora mali]|uniref:NADH-ubiquinone oxidoreductase 29.9 kDa subunit, mitochondrial n=1 Tax=Cytospora mali TaxID=578113 RepID=A0A194VY65_CYTMA|nr:hypothetical protein VM1G_04444 [Valsa mali]
MRPSFRLLASVKPARYLEAGAPTGLTGLFTDASPRSTLLFLYSTTIDKLKAVPETSVYRQSVEALTNHRLSVVEGVKPAGYDEWLAKAKQALDEHPEYFTEVSKKTSDGSHAAGVQRDGRFFVVKKEKPDLDIRHEEWDGEPDDGPELEGPRSAEEKKYQESIFTTDPFEGRGVDWVDEPKLTAAQVEELENKIGAGLIEEVIQVAEGELQLVDTMIEAKAWESLDEKPKEGQWAYFERKE